jgi:hypothetical protein
MWCETAAKIFFAISSYYGVLEILLFSQNFPLPRQGFGSSDPTDHPTCPGWTWIPDFLCDLYG